MNSSQKIAYLQTEYAIFQKELTALKALNIIFGSRPKDDIAISNAILYNGLADYIEEFDDKLWVRTIAL